MELIQSLLGQKIEYRNYTRPDSPGNTGIVIGGRTAERGGGHSDGITSSKDTATVLFVRTYDPKVQMDKLVEVDLGVNTIYFPKID